MRSGGVVMTTAIDLAPGAQRLAELVARVSDDELVKPTPCPAYTVGDLIDHVSGLARAFTAAARKERGPYVEQTPSGQAARLEPGWRARIPADLQRLARAWGEPGAWTGMTRIAGMDVPFGPSRPVPDDAPPLDRVVALAGRDTSWAPAGSPRRQE